MCPLLSPARQGDLLIDERSGRPFSVGALAEQSNNLRPLTWRRRLNTVCFELLSNRYGRTEERTLNQGQVTLQPTVNRPDSLGVKPLLGSKTTLLLLSDSHGFIDVGRPPRRDKKSVIGAADQRENTDRSTQKTEEMHILRRQR
jgi:hypothetical protein